MQVHLGQIHISRSFGQGLGHHKNVIYHHSRIHTFTGGLPLTERQSCYSCGTTAVAVASNSQHFAFIGSWANLTAEQKAHLDATEFKTTTVTS